MLPGIRNAVAGLQSSDLQMDVLGTRLTSGMDVPFPEVLGSTETSGTLPLSLPLRGDNNGKTAIPATDAGTSFSQGPGFLPPATVSALSANDPALDMGLYLVAQAAYRMNARFVSAANYELKELTRLGQ